MFENRFYSTDKMLKEYIIKVLLKKRFISDVISIVLGLIMSIITYKENNKILFGSFICCVLIIFLATILLYILTLKQMKENDSRIHNGQKFESIVSFDDKISINEGSFSLSIDYSQIINIYKLKYSFVLMFGKRNAILIEPDSFSIGNFENFKDYIKEKCPTAKWN